MDFSQLDKIVVGSVTPTYGEIRAIPLFATLSESDFEQISRGLTCIHIPKGEYLYRQGMDADSAFFVQSGFLNVVSTLPGGKQTQLAKLGPGSIIGETSLISSSVRSASVWAESNVIGFFMEMTFFQGALAQLSPAADRILKNLLTIVSERLRTQHQRLIEIENKSVQVSTCLDSNGVSNDIDGAAQTCTFPYQRYLSRLDFFTEFKKEELEVIDSLFHGLELKKGLLLFEKDEHPISCFLVVRGALELCIAVNGNHTPLAVFGPGSILGSTEIIAGGTRVACGRVREDSVLLEISASRLNELLHDHNLLALKFQHALCKHLIMDLGRINKRYARMVSQNMVNEI